MKDVLSVAVLAVWATVSFAESVEDHVNDIWRKMMADRWSPKTGLIYATKPANVKPACEFENGLFRWSKENKDGYGRGMSDCSIVSGIGLTGICDAYAVTGDEKLRAEAHRVAKGLVSNATAHGYKGFVARGICEEDGKSICALSSIDQFTHWFHGLWHFAASPLASADDRRQVAGLFVDVLERIERVATAENKYNFGQADGAPDPRGICGVWSDKPAKEWGSVHGATRLAMFYLATWNLTGDAKWKGRYDGIIDKALEVNLRLRDENPHQWRWVMPTYSILQMACANDVLYAIETDPKRKALIADCLRAGAKVADGRAKDMLKDPSKKWYGMCPDAELALSMVYSPDFDFDADEQGILRDRILKQSPWNSLAVTHYYGAYWRARRRGYFAAPPAVRETDFRPVVRKDGCAGFGGLIGKPMLVIGPGWSKTVTTGTVAFAAAPEGGWTMQVRAAYPADTKFTSTYFDIAIPVSYRRYALDGVDREFPAEKGKPFLGDGKSSFALYLPDGVKLTFSGVKSHVEDARCFNAKMFTVRFYFTRTDADGMANFALDCKLTAEQVDGTLRDFCRVPRGVANLASAKFTDGPDWIVSDFNRVTKPGSPLDFSGVDFTSPDGKTRYFGGNCSWSAAFLEKDESDRVADEVKRLGYNIVRAHQHDTQFLPKGAKSSAEIDPAAFDRFDYFVAAMKKRGIAFTTDCYSSRKFLAADPGLADLANSYREMKAALAVRPEAMENWKAFTRAFLCHVNPYTGLALKDDPTLVCLNLVNEDNYDVGICRGMRLLKDTRKDFASDLDWERFLYAKQMEIHRAQYDFVKKELGVKAPVTSLNMCAGVDYCERRSLFDVVDLHMYFAHPTYWDPTGVRYPHAFHSQLGQEGQGMIMLANFFQRDWTRPCFSTEYRQCAPNVFRSECGALVGAYAALQDWQGLVGYGYAEGAYSFRGMPTIQNPFDTASDPVALMMDRQTALLFRRGDVRPACGRLALAVPKGDLFPADLPRHLPRNVRELGLQTGVGFVRGDAPDGVRVESYASVSNRAAKLACEPVIVSDTEELLFDRSNRVFRAVTDRSEVLLASYGKAAARSFSAEVLDEGAAALSLHALDGAPIARSGKLVFFHLTDSANDGTVFEDGLLRREKKAGKGRVLIRRQRVRVKFDLPVARVVALACDGSVAGEMKPEADGSYVLRTDAFAGGVLAYAVERAE